MRDVLGAALCVAALGMRDIRDTAYTQRKEDQRKAHEDAVKRKQKVREEIRARRKAKEMP